MYIALFSYLILDETINKTPQDQINKTHLSYAVVATSKAQIE